MTAPIVTIKQGQLIGTTDTDLDGGIILKYSGIPYAKPPIGPLRFKAPQPVEPWTGVREATKEGEQCLSKDFLTLQPAGSEDCLYLNVFTKELSEPDQILKPVMVFFHGGGFVAGSASENMHGPKYLLTQDIVLVTVNYRLGIFGFLSLDDTSLEIPGNAGLKDQTLALRWVQGNIASFGGDPDNITIFGVSAGGASVQFQMLSPTAKGLFHKAIAQSGSVLNPWAWGQRNAIQVARELGQVVSTEKEALEVLANTPTMELYQASLKLSDVIADSSKRRPFGPVIENPNPTAFLTENPSELLASGRYNHVPTIFGVTNNEGLIYEFLRVQMMTVDVDPLECGIIWNLGLEEGSEKRAKVKQLIKDFYFQDTVSKEGFFQVLGDAMFSVGVIESIKLALEKSSCPIYYYVFSYDAPLGNALMKLVKVDENLKGIAHGTDQMFLFSSSMTAAMGQEIKGDDRRGIDETVKIWTDFARTGKPHEQWEPVEIGNLKYFDIDKDASLRPGPPFAERVEFWETILGQVAGLDANYKVDANP